jgi:hypothetical protein
VKEVGGNNLRVRHIGRFIVLVHSADPPGDDEWGELLELCRELPKTRRPNGLVYSDGGAPTLKQRAALRPVLGEVTEHLSVITGSEFARVVAAAIRWFFPTFRTFSPDNFDEALDHIGAVGSERLVLRRAVDDLRRAMRDTGPSVTS